MNSQSDYRIDVHTHILPKSWPDLRERYGYGGFVRLDHVDSCTARMMRDDEFFREVESNLWDPERRIEEFTSRGVSHQVLSTVPVMFSYWANADHAADLSRLLNDHLADVVATYPDRFFGLGTLPMQDPEAACRELERCVKDLGLHGIEIGTHVNDWNLDDAQVVEVLATAERLGAAVFVHPWDMMGADRMERYWLKWLVGMPAETSHAICSLMFGGVFDKLPDLKVCFAHGGGAFPGTFGRIQHGYEARPDLCATEGNASPRDYIGRFYVDSLVLDDRFLAALIDLMGVECVTVGSDYPFPLGEDPPAASLDRLDIADDALRAINWRNAAGFLGVDLT